MTNKPEHLSKKEKRLKRQELARRKNFLTWFLVVGISFIIITGAFFLAWKFTDSTSSLDEVKTEAQWENSKGGGEEAPAQLVEYSDFQCPACRAWSAELDNLLDQFGDDLNITYRHYPLGYLHSRTAALAAEAAGRQGAFWPMHDWLFENQTEWSRLNIEEFNNLVSAQAEELELDVEQFKTDLNADLLREKIRSDYDSGRQAGVRSTPTFFLNGQAVKLTEFSDLRNAIQEVVTDFSSSTEEGDVDLSEEEVEVDLTTGEGESIPVEIEYE
ncbi:MAG: DsbA family protein [Patescibacteria group bacterium]